MTGQLAMPKCGWAIFGERPIASELVALLAAVSFLYFAKVAFAFSTRHHPTP